MADVVIDLSTLAPEQGFIIQGDAAGDYAGQSVSSAGDVNGDGIADLIVGARLGDDGGSYAGEAYVVFGKQGATRANIDLSTLAPGDGFIIQGDAAGDKAGYSVSSTGDVNGDGLADLIVGAPNGDDGGTDAGEAYVIFGKMGAARANIDLTALAPGDGFIIQGDAAGDHAGQSVSSAGDVNGDGIADLIVGAPYGDDGGGEAGEAYVIFGKAGATRANIDLSALVPGDGFIIQGDAEGDQAGQSVSSAGDVNGDGFADLIVGAPFGDEGGGYTGEAYVVFGKQGATRANIDLSTLAPGDGFIIQGDAAGDKAGYSVSSTGDVNGDGLADLIVGAPNGDDGGTDAGEAYVIFGNRSFGNEAPIIDAPEASYTTLVNTPFTFLVNAVDPNDDPLNFTPGAALHGTVVVTPVAFTYTPEQGFSGTDSFLVTVDDGRDGVAEQLVTVTVAALPAPSDWRLFASDGYIGEIGGNGAVIGRPAYQNIKVTDVPGRVSFDPSFNRGGDIIRLSGDAEDWRVVRLGSGAVFSDDDTFVTVPVGTTGLQVIFDDGIRVLRIEGGELKLNYQVITTVLEPIFVPAQDELPVTNVPNPLGRLFLSPEAAVVAGANGRLDVFGTSAEEEVRILYGNVKLDPSFNRGGDVLVLDRPAEDFTAVRSGSSIQLDSIDVDVLIPISTAETTIRFADGDRTITFDTLANSAVIGDQLIGFSSVQLIA